ncbi:MAG: hypothetical protein WCG06_05195, partial [Candidatus Omnitrophota bacterium]
SSPVSGMSGVVGGTAEVSKLLADLEQNLTQDPKDTKSLFRRALYYDVYRLKLARQLIGYYQRYLKSGAEPGSGRTRFVISRVSAIRDWLRRRDADRSVATIETNRAAFRVNNYRGPAKDMLIPTKGNPALFKKLINKALYLQAQNRPEEAEREFLQALLCNPQSIDALASIDKFASDKFKKHQEGAGS